VCVCADTNVISIIVLLLSVELKLVKKLLLLYLKLIMSLIYQAIRMVITCYLVSMQTKKGIKSKFKKCQNKNATKL
jgi:hypothetical protein